MLRRKLLILLLALSVVLLAFSGGGFPERIGKWRVEVGPPGNEFYQAPKEQPPSEAVLRWANIFAPHAKVEKWKVKSSGYRLYAKVGREQYKFYVRHEGQLYKFEYKNTATGVEEVIGKLILQGTKKTIPVTEVPKAALDTLATAMPDAKPSEAWLADTIAGPRYVILIEQMAFYARPDGQIQAAGLLKDGALNEVKPSDVKIAPRPAVDEKVFMAELKQLLAQYRDRFNFENQIKKLGPRPKSADGSFRYVVMGDSRSQWDLWSNIVKHIDGLDPKPDFVINSGDVVPMGYAREYHDYYIPALLQADIPHFIAIGNHDDGLDSTAREFRYLFGDNALNYYFDYGRARYVFFDNVTVVDPYDKTLQWVDRVLSETPAAYRKYVACHRPPRNIEKWAYHAWSEEESKVFTALMTKHKVDEVYHGHIHAYSTTTFGGVNYTLTGGGGAGLHDRFGPMGNVHHYLICDVMPDGTVKQQVVRFYDTEKEESNP